MYHPTVLIYLNIKLSQVNLQNMGNISKRFENQKFILICYQKYEREKWLYTARDTLWCNKWRMGQDSCYSRTINQLQVSATWLRKLKTYALYDWQMVGWWYQMLFRRTVAYHRLAADYDKGSSTSDQQSMVNEISHPSVFEEYLAAHENEPHLLY